MVWLAVVETAGCGRYEFEVATDAAAPARAVTTGQAHSCAITDGTLHCWGLNTTGQLGVGDVTPHAAPMIIAPSLQWARVSAGSGHTCAITSEGQVSCWGDNTFGQLGLGDFVARTTPVAVSLPAAAVRVATMRDHTCAVLVDDSLYCWGRNIEGQLGLSEPVGSPDHESPQLVPGTFENVACGQGHTLAVDTSGELSGTGRNTFDELGLGTPSSGQLRVLTPALTTAGPWAAIAAGQNASCGVAGDSGLYCWGANGASSLGTGDTTPHDVPVQIAASETWVSVDIDTFHACGISAGHALYCWGRNVEGQLGLDDVVDRTVPTATPLADWAEVSVSRFHACALRLDGSVWCTGGNDNGELGTGDTMRRAVWTRVALP